jgi:hypothetical protein
MGLVMVKAMISNGKNLHMAISVAPIITPELSKSSKSGASRPQRRQRRGMKALFNTFLNN